MEEFTSYIIKSSGILLLLYGYYWLFLRKQTFFTINRFYLLISLILGMILPFISIEITNPIFTAGKFHPSLYVEHIFSEVNTSANDTATPITPQKMYSYAWAALYLAGALFFLVRYSVALAQIVWLIRRNPKKSVRGTHRQAERTATSVFFLKLLVYLPPPRL